MKKYLIDFYLMYVNDFLTIDGIANYYGLEPAKCARMIKLGRKLNQNLCNK
jgi:hypothetical protein